ncbi:hypothetical protein ACA910_009746 [Epithemia clementina (nom. ined.)]
MLTSIIFHDDHDDDDDANVPHDKSSANNIDCKPVDTKETKRASFSNDAKKKCGPVVAWKGERSSVWSKTMDSKPRRSVDDRHDNGHNNHMQSAKAEMQQDHGGNDDKGETKSKMGNDIRRSNNGPFKEATHEKQDDNNGDNDDDNDEDLLDSTAPNMTWRDVMSWDHVCWIALGLALGIVLQCLWYNAIIYYFAQSSTLVSENLATAALFVILSVKCVGLNAVLNIAFPTVPRQSQTRRQRQRQRQQRLVESMTERSYHHAGQSKPTSKPNKTLTHDGSQQHNNDDSKPQDQSQRQEQQQQQQQRRPEPCRSSRAAAASPSRRLFRQSRLLLYDVMEGILFGMVLSAMVLDTYMVFNFLSSSSSGSNNADVPSAATLATTASANTARR